MLSALSTGFFLGLSLILAIGAQNAFVLRQGILGQHVFYVALFCAISDLLLIVVGIVGITFFLNRFIIQYIDIIFGFSAIWLFSYGIIRLNAVFKSNITIKVETSESKNLLSTLSILSVLTFANPHVYLDTMVLIGSISQQFSRNEKIYFAIGASLSSLVFFFSLAYGAKLIAPKMKKPSYWRILDLLIAIVMFTIAIKLAITGNWL